jgi:N-alpha-acetyl-L-2,4-diaminobutyrate deacetylase
MPTPVEVALDLDRPGRSDGYLRLSPVVEGSVADVRVPVAVLANGRGPTLLVTAAVHGDEYEGPIALAKLVRSLDPGALQGRLIAVPFLNQRALGAAQRRSPDDGLDLNRSFPGDPTGSPSEVLAHLVSTTLVPAADAVIDLHTGGTNSTWIPCAMTHPLADRALLDRILDLIVAMRLPAGVVVDESDKPGMFDTYVENLGKPFVCCEFGGGMLTRPTLAVAEASLRNALIHLDMIESEPRMAEWRGRTETRLLEIPSLDHAMTAMTSGLFEPLAEPGDTVFAGQAIGRVHATDDLGRAPETIRAPVDGILFHRRASSRIDPGQRAGMVARPLVRA